MCLAANRDGDLLFQRSGVLDRDGVFRQRIGGLALGHFGQGFFLALALGHFSQGFFLALGLLGADWSAGLFWVSSDMVTCAPGNVVSDQCVHATRPRPTLWQLVLKRRSCPAVCAAKDQPRCITLSPPSDGVKCY